MINADSKKDFGDVMVVGSPLQDGKGTDAGAAYVYRRDPTSGAWNEEARVIGSIEGPEAVVGEVAACTAGKASVFPCGRIDLMALSLAPGVRQMTPSTPGVFLP